MKIVVVLMVVGPFLFSGCSSKKKGHEKPLAMSTAMGREAEGLKRYQVTTADQKLIFSVLAKNAPQVTFIKNEAEIHLAVIDLGTTAPLECFFYNTEINSANALKKVNDSIFANTQALGKVVQKEFSYFNAGAIGNVPYLHLDTAYVSERGGHHQAGNLKSLVALKGRDSVICLHNEVGYRETFFKVVSEIVNSFEYERSGEPPFSPFHMSIMVFKLNGLPLGHSVNYYLRGEKNQNVLVNKSSKFLPMNSGEFLPLDDVLYEISNADGKLVYGKYRAEHDLKVNLSLDLISQSAGLYSVEGEVKGKKIAKTIKNKEITSNYGQAKLLSRNFFELGLTNFSLAAYMPELSPTKLINVQFSTKYANDEGAEVTFSIQGEKNVMTVDPSGAIRSINFKVGEASIVGETIYSKGAFK